MLIQSCSEWPCSLSLSVDGSWFRALVGVVWSESRTWVQCMDEFQHFCWWWGSVQSPSKLHRVRGRSVSSHTQGRSAALHHFSNRLPFKKITLKLINTPTSMHIAQIQHILWKETTSFRLQTGIVEPSLRDRVRLISKPFICQSLDYPSLHFLSQDLLKIENTAAHCCKFLGTLCNMLYIWLKKYCNTSCLRPIGDFFFSPASHIFVLRKRSQ